MTWRCGSGLLTQGISQSVLTGSLLEILGTPVASWTYRGRELPYLPNVVTPRMTAAIATGGPVALGWAAPDLSRATQVAEAEIPVEHITGPALLISGGEDRRVRTDRSGPALEARVVPQAGSRWIRNTDSSSWVRFSAAMTSRSHTRAA
ncbi:MAG TPA: hypothetical protein VN840_16240 [Streptosporangiaceae bacterium]|nr:hypothetical protein [Streptosporangiaceae bacterium]